MKKPNHNQFIQISITKILEEMISASRGVGDGIETYAVYDYILQSTFLKMTGAQEQKFKCICWELATNDYEFRYDKYLNDRNPLSLKGMSSYEHKKEVYNVLIRQIKKHDTIFNVENYLDRDSIKNNIYQKIEELFSSSRLSFSVKKHLIFFLDNNSKVIENNHFGKEKNLFENVLQERYTQLYNHRNRCAHNTLSYQQNLPTLDTLRREDYKYQNYFVYFSILILIDEIMMALYKKYLEVLE